MKKSITILLLLFTALLMAQNVYLIGNDQNYSRKENNFFSIHDFQKILFNEAHISAYDNQVNTTDADISDPADGLIIHEDNMDTYILTNDLDKVHITGWSIAGNISNIKLYKLLGSTPDTNFDHSLGSGQNPNSGSWYRDADIGPGEHTIYANVRCNYSGCPLSGTNTATRTFTYLKPYNNSNFDLSHEGDSSIKISIALNYNSSINHNFYYRVYRSEASSNLNGTYIGNWAQNNEVIDNNVNPGIEYCYWVEVALDSSGSYKSGRLSDQYKCTTILGLEDKISESSIKIYPNPTQSLVNISANNSSSINKVSILDINGKLLKRVYGNFDKIDINNLSSGIYLFQIETNKTSYIKRIIKK